MTTRCIAALALLLSAACGVTADGPPEIVVDRTACAHCGMLVSEPVYAAAYGAPGSSARVFDDIGCLVEAARKEPRPDQLQLWFHDTASGGWIDGRSAAFVSSPSLRTPMGGGTIAYRDAAAARESAARLGGRVLLSSGDLLRSSINTGEGHASPQVR